MSCRTISETSECDCATQSSVESREDFQEIMDFLGVSAPDMLAQDRFTIDRKLIENLLFGGDKNAATDLFLKIMKETRTYISWPAKLKQDSKSKKDPHVSIIGRVDDVKLAHEKVSATFGPKESRVNMKIDVSYTEHSHIIGKGGHTIKSVMEETMCHIHFPDSNRNNPLEKSNQVSISGDVDNVERARAKVRELTPLIFCFELPILEALSLTPNKSCPYIKYVQDKYNIQVMYRTRQKLNSTLVVVKGCEWEVENVKEATQLLISYMCKSLEEKVQVQMILEITPQFHNVIMGKDNENLKAIMMNTMTQITFIDAFDPNIPSLKKSNVTITGAINDVYLARQQLIGSLPVLLMFDVPDTSSILDQKNINDVMNDQNVLITTRYKPKQNITTLIIKGIERNIGNIYEAHRKLMGLNNPEVKVNIPETYFIKKREDNHTQNGIISTPPGMMSPMGNVLEMCNSWNGFIFGQNRLTQNPKPHTPPELTKINTGYKRPWESPTKLQTLKLEANKAMRTNVNADECRVPNSTWSGLMFSRSTPDEFQIGGKRIKLQWDYENSVHDNDNDDLRMSNTSEFSSSSTSDWLMTMPMNDLPTIFVNLGLEQYTRIFEENEVDLLSFSTLNELDLKEIGINALGARRKLMLCISELKRRFRQKRFRGSVAPGAERTHSKDNLNEIDC